MSAFAAIFTLIAVGLSIFVIADLIEGDSILKYPYLIIPLSLMLASLTGGLIFVTSLYLLTLAGLLLILFTLAIIWPKQPPTFQDDINQTEHDTDTIKIFKDQ